MSQQFSDLTPFYAAQVLNKLIAANGIEANEVRPQMMYSYAKNNRIASNYATRQPNEKIYFVGESFKKFADKYIERLKNGTVSSRVNIDELTKQFM